MKLDLLKKNKETFSRKKDSIDPRDYWGAIFVTCLVIVLASFAFGFYLFKKIDKGTVIKDSELAEGSKKIRKEELVKALEYFNKKEEARGSILLSPPPVVDPSL